MMNKFCVSISIFLCLSLNLSLSRISLSLCFINKHTDSYNLNKSFHKFIERVFQKYISWVFQYLLQIKRVSDINCFN